ncbi:MAG: hypothetical protein A3E83_04020 [Gammaproteobacteria bacterium RIFCSPHIGHO2_12_FULL_41_20]|nr:MAG: hypothetical protein A3E83_04020 [Gammaproteobacteria bacterium RIFCSPHIGHO2_12_FULL_41_20]
MTAVRFSGTEGEVVIDVPVTDATPLLAQAPQQHWYRRLASGVFNRAVKPVYNGLCHVVKHPIATVTSIFTALPTAIYAFLDATHTRPTDVNAQWWANISPGQKLYSLSNAASSLLVNTIINIDFLTAMWTGLKESFASCCKGAKYFFGNTGLVLLSLVGSIVTAALAYGAFLWLPLGGITAAIPALLSFVIDFAIGYVTIKNLVHKIQNSRNPDIKVQKEYVDKLKHIKAEYLQEINDFLQQKHITAILGELQAGRIDESRKTQLKADLQQALQDVFEQKLKPLSALGVNIFREKTGGECAKEWAGTLFDITLATALFVPVLATYTDVGFRGVALLEQFAGSNVLEKSARAAKIAIGALPALITAIFFPLVAMDFRKTMLQLVTHLYHHPTEIPGALLLLAVNGLSTGSMRSISQGVADNPDNVFSIPSSNTTLGQLYIILNALGGGVANAALTVDPVYLSAPDPATSELESLVRYWDNPGKRLIPHATAEKLRACGLFQSAPAPRATQVDGYIPIPDGMLATP